MFWQSQTKIKQHQCHSIKKNEKLKLQKQWPYQQARSGRMRAQHGAQALGCHTC